MLQRLLGSRQGCCGRLLLTLVGLRDGTVTGFYGGIDTAAHGSVVALLNQIAGASCHIVNPVENATNHSTLGSFCFSLGLSLQFLHILNDLSFLQGAPCAAAIGFATFALWRGGASDSAARTVGSARTIGSRRFAFVLCVNNVATNRHDILLGQRRFLAIILGHLGNSNPATLCTFALHVEGHSPIHCGQDVKLAVIHSKDHVNQFLFCHKHFLVK